MDAQFNLISSGPTEEASEIAAMPGTRHRLVIGELGSSPYLFSRALYWPRIGQLFLFQGNGLEFHDAWVQGNTMEIEFSAPRYNGSFVDLRPLVLQLRSLFGSASTSYSLYALEYPAGSASPTDPAASLPGNSLPGLVPPELSVSIPWIPIAVLAAAVVLLRPR